MGSVITGDVVDSTDVLVPTGTGTPAPKPAKTDDEDKDKKAEPTKKPA